MFFVKISVQIRPNSVIFRSKFKLFDLSTQLKFVPNFLNFPKFVQFGGLRNFLTFESQNLATPSPPLSSGAAWSSGGGVGLWSSRSGRSAVELDFGSAGPRRGGASSAARRGTLAAKATRDPAAWLLKAATAAWPSVWCREQPRALH